MSEKSTIEWTDATWNPSTGCTKVSSGCKKCYAERVFKRVYPGRPFSEIREHHNRILDPLRWRRPRKIFVNSLSDLFHAEMPPQLLDTLFAVMALASRHTFQILTKRPDRMASYFDLSRVTDLKLPAMIQAEARIARTAKRIADLRGEDTSRPDWGISLKVPYPNVWIGVSVEDQKTADERIPELLRTPAAVHFVSYEPALGPWDVLATNCGGDLKYGWVRWVIAGGESGPGARPSHPEWFRSVRDQCQAAGVPFFFKQWGEWGPIPSEPFKASRYQWVLASGLVPACEVSKDRMAEKEYLLPGEGVQCMARLGKKRAGRLLDGREWNEYPECGQIGSRQVGRSGGNLASRID